MKLILNNPKDLPAPVGGYSQSVEISDDKILVFISGQIAESVSGEVHRPALTVVLVQTLDSKWLLEIDAIAAV